MAALFTARYSIHFYIPDYQLELKALRSSYPILNGLKINDAYFVFLYILCVINRCLDLAHWSEYTWSFSFEIWTLTAFFIVPLFVCYSHQSQILYHLHIIFAFIIYSFYSAPDSILMWNWMEHILLIFFFKGLLNNRLN